MNYNHGTYVGRLTADPTVKPMPSGTTLLTFTVAVSDDRPNKEGQFDTDFIPVVVWGARAERYATRRCSFALHHRRDKHVDLG